MISESFYNNSIIQKNKPEEMGAYTPVDVGRYLNIPISTVRAWLKGYDYLTKSGLKHSNEVVNPEDKYFVSFKIFVEIFILNSIRKDFNVPLAKVRAAIEHLKVKYDTKYPLADFDLFTDSRSLFLFEFGQFINISQKCQIEMNDLVKSCMKRIERDNAGQFIRFYPLFKDNNVIETVSINPMIQFGKPCITRKGIPTNIIFCRFNSGETIESLEDDYECSENEIKDAIDYEQSISRKIA